MSHPTKLISITLQHFKKRIKLFNKKIKVQLKKTSSIHQIENQKFKMIKSNKFKKVN